MMNRSLIGFLATALLLTACEKNPIEKLTNPVPDGAVAPAGSPFVIYDGELKTGGGIGLIPTGDNQSIVLNDRSEPRLSANSLRYSWNGQPVNGQQAFAGFSLVITPDFSTLNSAPVKNLSAAGYTKLTLFVRGHLSAQTKLRIEGPDSGSGHASPFLEKTSLGDDWEAVTVPITAPADFAAVRIFLTVSLQYAQPAGTTQAGEGGTVFLDKIRYEK